MQRINHSKLATHERRSNRQLALNTPNTTKTPKARPHAHLLPTLFDRLCDDAPTRKTEAPGEYAVSRQRMREIVQRDLAYLLNTGNMDDLLDRVHYPQAAASTINFGMPALAGSYLSSHKWEEIELLIRRAVEDFEPRLVSKSLVVMPLFKENSTYHYNVLLFEIRGQIHMGPYPMEFMVQSAVDLETNRVSVVSSTAR